MILILRGLLATFFVVLGVILVAERRHRVRSLRDRGRHHQRGADRRPRPAGATARMTRLASVDGHDPTRVITRRCVALTVDAFLLAVIPFLTITIVGRATLRRGDCPSPLPRNRNCLALERPGPARQQGRVPRVLRRAGAALPRAVRRRAGDHRRHTGQSPARDPGGAAGRKPRRSAAFARPGGGVGRRRHRAPPAHRVVERLVHPGHRRVGDWLAGTFVVRRPAASVGETTQSG